MNTEKSTQTSQKIAFLQRMLGHRICEALADEDIIEVMANPDGKVWFESRTSGMIEAGKIGEFEAKNFLSQLAGLKERFINFNQPYIETTLPFNNERIEGTISPITKRAAFTIRKPAAIIFTLEDYIDRGIIEGAHADIICDAIENRLNIIFSGGTGSGKTTMTNAAIAKMTEVSDSSQRILILEDTPEIQCEMPNVYPMLTSSHVSMQTLLKIAMRSRPDRILIGEVRDSAALDLLKSWNTGCPGGIATLHANTSDSTLLRLSNLAQEAGIPPPNDLIGEAVDLIVNLKLDKGHPAGRCVDSITRLHGFVGEHFEKERLK